MFQVQAIASKSCRYWHVRRNEIDMEPEYQRAGGVWSQKDQSFLIDSILNDYDIPKLYLADFSTLPSDLNEEKRSYAVIDGKQRLEAIFDFFDNALPLSRDFILEGHQDINMKGLLYKDLQKNFPKLASKVEEFPLPIMHVVTDEKDRINELFVRLNRGANLTGPEKRNAMIGPVPKILRRLAKHKFFENNTKYNAKRGQHLNQVAKLFLFELNGDVEIDTKRKQLDEMVESYEEYSKDTLRNVEGRVYNILDKMTRVFGLKDELLKSQGLIPVYYWLVRDSNLKQMDMIRPLISGYLAGVSTLKNRSKDEISFREREFLRAQRSTNDAWSHKLRLKVFKEIMAQT